jgi:biotin carboxylase
MPHLLLLLPSLSYRGEAFLEAAAKVGVSLTVGGESAPDFLVHSPGGFLSLDLHDPASSVSAAVEFAKTNPINVVLGVNDNTTVLASRISAALGLPSNSIDSVCAARNKHTMRELLRKHGLPTPHVVVYGIDEIPEDIVQHVNFPCILKPLTLSASCGVIRVDDPESFRQAFIRVGDLLKSFGRLGQEEADRQILIEDFIPGTEVALEGLLTNGELRPLAMFDKPDPLDGPYFEETIYVTPSRLTPALQKQIHETLAQAALAIGLREGPVHGELRINDQGVWIIEVAARSIGGKCSRTLQFGTGMSLEELILFHALGRELPPLDLQEGAAGVMMIPIPKEGIFERVDGQRAAQQVPGVEELVMTAESGDHLIPLPEGTRYLGFIVARRKQPEEVEATLREAHRRLTVVMRPLPSRAGRPEVFRI